MHVALIVSKERLGHEHAMLDQLAHGLGEAGCTVTRILPTEVEPETLERTHAERTETILMADMRVPSWLRWVQGRRLMEALTRAEPDVLYALGRRAWPLGQDLARRLDRPLVLDIWSSELARHAPRGHAANRVAAYIVPGPALAASLRRRVGSDLVGVVPYGVPLPPEPRPVLAHADQAIALAVIGSCHDVPPYRAFLTGLRRALRDIPQMHAFLELRGPGEQEIWRLLRRLQLEHQVSVIGDADGVRDLLVRCDVLVMPQHGGEIMSITLQAMAAGVPVIAGADPCADHLVSGRTAEVVATDEADRWAAVLRRIAAEPLHWQVLGRSARQFVAEQHRPEEQTRATIATLERACTGGSYAFHPDES